MRPIRVEPGPGQESVWDYPRPPRREAATRRVRVVLGGVEICATDRALRVLETSHPPVYYIPFADLHDVERTREPRATVCEFKGRAAWWTLAAGDRTSRACGWSYPEPTPAFAALADHLALYPERVDACYLDRELVTPQPGEFYGGWVTADIVGPLKGGEGTWGW